MQLKTFRAPDLAAALAQARQELGPNALVLATNESRGRLGLTQVEITVAVDHRGESRDQEIDRLAQEIDGLRRRLATEAPPPAPEPVAPKRRSRPDHAAKKRAAKAPRESRAPEHGIDAPLRAAVEALVRGGLSRDLALRFARIASGSLSGNSGAAGLSTAADRAMEDLLTFGRSPLGTHVLFVVGPPGSGKTTTVAKLAARTADRSDRRVVFAQSDLERLDALEQARIFSDHVGVELAPVRNPDDLTRAIRLAGRDGCVVVDTAGVGSSDLDRLKRLTGLRRACPAAQVLLLIPSGLHSAEARHVLDRFEEVRPTGVALSRVDDGNRIGELVTALASSRLPLVLLTNGHRIPDDIQEASPRAVARLLLRSGFRTQPRQELHR